MTRLKAVLFDMDGLLLDTERLSLKAFDRAAAEHGLDYEMSDYLPLVGLNRKRMERIFAARFPELPRVAFCTRWQNIYEELLADGVPLRPGVAEVLERISLPKAVVTSSGRSLSAAKLEAAGIAGHFKTIVGGDEVSQGKPRPEPYLTGAARLGVAATDCAAFEDSENGTLAALAAGCVTVQVPDLVPPGKDLIARGHLIVDTLAAGALAMGLI